MVSLPSSSSESSGEEAASRRYYRELARGVEPPDANCDFGIGYVPERCDCGILIPCETSWTTKNPGRRWVQCAKRKVSEGMNQGCGLLAWVDSRFDDQAVEVIRDLMRQKRELLAKRTDLCWDLKIRDEEIKALKVKVAGAGTGHGDLDAKLKDLVRQRVLEKEVDLLKKGRKQNLFFGIGLGLVVFVGFALAVFWKWYWPM